MLYTVGILVRSIVYLSYNQGDCYIRRVLVAMGTRSRLKKNSFHYRKKGTEVSKTKYNFKRISTYMHILKNHP